MCKYNFISVSIRCILHLSILQLVFKICAELGLCDTQPLVHATENTNWIEQSNIHINVSGNSQTCMFCKFAISQLENMIEDKQNQEEIKEAMEKLCDYLPSHYAGQCKALVDTYTAIIIDMIAKEATPEEVVYICIIK